MDSQNICTGQGYLVLKAAKWAADGLPPRNITMRLQSLAKRVELSFVPVSYTHLLFIWRLPYMFMYTDYNQHLLDNVKKIHFLSLIHI